MKRPEYLDSAGVAGIYFLLAALIIFIAVVKQLLI